jgi:YD repeat-containing protein
VPVLFLLVFFLVAVFLAVTQETGEQEIQEQEGEPGEEFFSLGYEEEEWIETDFFPGGPPRWFRSNAGGMTLEEIPSQLGALRNKYALVIDYVTFDELDPRLTLFYKDGYFIEIRILYEDGKESRKQWMFLDRSGNIMLNAAFTLIGDDAPEPDAKSSIGFIEVYNDEGRIARDYSLFEDGGEILTGYFYNEGVLVRAETRERDSKSVEYKITYTDTYRYNRSYSLRNVERVYHEDAGIDPVSLVFPGRVLDVAREKDFMKEKLIITSDFLDIQQVAAGDRMVFDTDSKGRALGETLYNSKNEVVWTVKNTWVGDRVTAILKIEGDERRLTEYDYDSSGKRIAQRDFRNGVLERQVFINGNKETEELYLNGDVALRAFWEDGRKISEERIRRR